MNHHTPGSHLLLLGLATLATSGITCAADLVDARSAYAEWARLKSQISEERSDWQREQTLLADTLSAARVESEALDERIEELKSSSSETDRQRATLQGAIAEAKSTAEALGTKLSEAEAALQTLVPLLPAPLQAELQPRLQSLPDGSAKNTLPIGQRVLLLATVLGHIEKFSGNYNLVSEIRDLGAGRSAEVKTLYLGLAVAYFADAAGTTAGYGAPGPSGWEWKTVEGDLATRVGLALAIHESTRPPAFVTLPIEIR